MAGRGPIGAEDREVLPGIWVQSKDLSWKHAVDPLHYDKPEIAGVGLGRSFARALKEASHPDASIGLIPAAFGGSALEEWKPGSTHYSEAVRRTRAALRNGRLRGILWHQGEADSKDESLAGSYAHRFDTFIRQLRADLGAPDLPIIVGELGRFYGTGQTAARNLRMWSMLNSSRSPSQFRHSTFVWNPRDHGQRRRRLSLRDAFAARIWTSLRAGVSTT